MTRSTIPAVCCLLVAAIASADDGAWPGFHGPGRNGVARSAPELVDALPKEMKPAWEVLTIADGKPATHTSPVCSDSVAVLHTCVEKRQKQDNGKMRKFNEEVLVGVSLADGKQLWRIEHPGKSYNTPVLAGGKLYYVRGDGHLACIDAAKGTELWTCRVQKGGTNSSPAIAAGVVIVNAGRDLVAVDLDTRKVRWKVEVKNWNNSPAVWTHDGKQYVLTGNEEIVCVDAKEGTKLWTMPGTKLKKDPASVAIHGDRMAVLWEGMGLHVFELSLKGAKKIATCEAFVPNTGGAHQATTPVFDGRHVYAVDKKKTFCFDAEKDEVVWEGPKGDPHPSPILADGKLIVNNKRSLMLLDAKTGKQLGEEPRIDSAGCSSCAFSGGKLLVNEGRSFRCYDFSKDSN
ncbi:MAG: PQQ-binding-like beta-propeller repeat protein [Phycisphaerae bacterium]